MRDSSHSPTIREIAKVAGVSPMTVSRSLNDSSLQKSSTRERIKHIARSMGWKPNPLVSALMSQRARQHVARETANLAIFDPRSDEPEANSELITGCLQRAAELGYQAEVFPYRIEESNPQRMSSILHARGIRGIVVMPLPVATYTIDFDFTGFAAVTIGYSLMDPVLPRVANDTQNNVHTALRHYEERGYNRVGLVMSDDANRRMLCQYSSAADSYDRFFSDKLRVKQLILPDENFSPERSHEIISWIRRESLEGVLSSAQHIRESLIQAGAKIPDDFAYIHLHRSGPETTSVDQLRKFVGHKATDLVTAMIQRNESHPVQYPQIIATPSVLVEGESVPWIKDDQPSDAEPTVVSA